MIVNVVIIFCLEIFISHLEARASLRIKRLSELASKIQ